MGDTAGEVAEAEVSLAESQPTQQAMKKTRRQRSSLTPSGKRDLKYIDNYLTAQTPFSNRSVSHPGEGTQLELETSSNRILVKHAHRIERKFPQVCAAQLYRFRQDIVRNRNNVATAICRLKDVQDLTHTGPQ